MRHILSVRVKRRIVSAPDASRRFTFDERFQFSFSENRDVAGDRVLKACGRRREVEGVLRVFEVMKTVYESRRKRISSSDAIDDIFDVIFF